MIPCTADALKPDRFKDVAGGRLVGWAEIDRRHHGANVAQDHEDIANAFLKCRVVCVFFLLEGAALND